MNKDFHTHNHNAPYLESNTNSGQTALSGGIGEEPESEQLTEENRNAKITKLIKNKAQPTSVERVAVV